MIKNILINFFICLVVSSGSVMICSAFEEPPTINVTKPAGGTIYTLCSSGCDFTTLEAADGNIGAGNTLRIKAGTYDSTTWDESGSSGNEIAIEAYGDGDVIIKGEMRLQGQYVIIDGGPNKNIIFRRSGSSGQRLLKPQTSNLTIWRIKVEGPTGVCSNTDNCGVLIKGYPTITPSNIKIYNSVFENCSHKGIYVSAIENGEIRNNIITGTGNSGLQINPHEDGARVDGLIVSGNAFYDNGDCSEMPGHNIYIQATTNGEGLRGVIIYNNLIWESNRRGLHIASIGSGMMTGDLKIYNNTFYNNDEYGVSFDVSVPNNKVELVNNIFYANGGGATSLSGATLKEDQNNLTTNPSFTSTAESEEHFLKLSSGSTGIDQGYDLSAEAVTDDFLGNPRPKYGEYDIGAYEYMVEAPQNLRIKSIE